MSSVLNGICSNIGYNSRFKKINKKNTRIILDSSKFGKNPRSCKCFNRSNGLTVISHVIKPDIYILEIGISIFIKTSPAVQKKLKMLKYTKRWRTSKSLKEAAKKGKF